MTGTRDILDEMICFEVYNTEHAFTRLYKGMLKDMNLTYPQFLVMLLLWQEDGQIVSAIGKRLGLESNTLTPLLKRLEKAGLVTRVRDPEDERRVRVSLTSEGRALRSRVKGIETCLIEATGMDMEELRVLLGSLRKLRKNLQSAA
ncbi:MarR family transcriptional regulator [Shimia sp. CNT1-13L.2]|uniref:MarR family winged helix-turn-helix transcriptional regulator n=1 Tax=Shimia sp. CNT1-13L.2 TaxID=2959663 RepID=UPI0020CE0216|nr:MarR family transcriptional regulator [Shimia sp. CNT1-13L.2]MCP9480738.1 MarR family transcriptional regulator [Shimia sp. CNT1-13L.2]